MRTVRFATFMLLAAGFAAPADAQLDDSRWLAYVGCWAPVDETEESGLLCFRPADGGVELTSVVDGEVVATETLVSDGQRRAVVADGCDGWEAVSFSEDGRRAFTSSEYVCGEDERAGSGVMSFIAPDAWIDVRSIEIGGENVAWVQTYELVGATRMAEEGVEDPREGVEIGVRGARIQAARPIDLEDVDEALDRMAPEAVVAWIATTGDDLDVEAADLIRYADASVPDQIIDVMVAVSNPDHFELQAENSVQRVDPDLRGRRVPARLGYRSYLAFNPFYRFGYGPFGYGYSPYRYSGYGYGLGFSPWGYGYGGYIPTIVRVAPRSDGRVVNGRGWTRGSGGSTGRAATARGSGGSRSGGGSVGSSGGSGGRSSTGRSARRRGGSEMSSAPRPSSSGSARGATARSAPTGSARGSTTRRAVRRR